MSGKSPGGGGEKTREGLRVDRETDDRDHVDVICTEPVKLLRLSRGPMLTAPSAFGPGMKLMLPKESPVARLVRWGSQIINDINAGLNP